MNAMKQVEPVAIRLQRIDSAIDVGIESGEQLIP